jgi:2'-5' RNA ligase
MLSDCSGQDLVNSFALVTYIPEPLGKFLDDLRRELVPGCTPHAHVTILPPRTLSATPQAAIEKLHARLPEFAPFEIGAGQVRIFPTSHVLYIDVGEGRDELLQMYKALNQGPLQFKEPFPYHPHITLAQNLTGEQSIELAAVAARRWSEYPYQRVFPAESLAFVQNTVNNLWQDLAQFQLHPAPSVHR